MKLSDDHLRALKNRLIASGVVGKTVHWRGEDNTIIGFSQSWNDFGVLYRQNSHRDALVRELADARIPFVIENMDVSDTPEIRDLFACLSAVIAGSLTPAGCATAAQMPTSKTRAQTTMRDNGFICTSYSSAVTKRNHYRFFRIQQIG